MGRADLIGNGKRHLVPRLAAGRHRSATRGPTHAEEGEPETLPHPAQPGRATVTRPPPRAAEKALSKFDTHGSPLRVAQAPRD